MTEKGLKNMFYPVNSVGGKDNIIITCMQEPFVNVDKLEVAHVFLEETFLAFLTNSFCEDPSLMHSGCAIEANLVKHEQWWRF